MSASTPTGRGAEVIEPVTTKTSLDLQGVGAMGADVHPVRIYIDPIDQEHEMARGGDPRVVSEDHIPMRALTCGFRVRKTMKSPARINARFMMRYRPGSFSPMINP